jgi:hypothetical protein
MNIKKELKKYQDYLTNKELKVLEVELQKKEIIRKENKFKEPTFIRKHVKGLEVVSECCGVPLIEGGGRCSQCYEGCVGELKTDY